jgi:tRNA-dihydrouridine synthase
MPEEHADLPPKAPTVQSRRFSVAPMMDWTDQIL